MDQCLDSLQALDPVNYLHKFTRHNTRPDSRPLRATRRTTVLPHVVPRNTYGSAHIRLGKTQVVTAITLMVGQPSATHPRSGELEVHVLCSPLAGKQYLLNGSMMSADEIAFSGIAESCKTASSVGGSDPLVLESFVRRIIVNSSVIDFEDLCIEEGKSTWKVVLTCLVLNNDGNIIDASIIGCVAALRNMKLPKTKKITEQDRETLKTKSRIVIINDTPNLTDNTLQNTGIPLPLHKLPVSLTIGMFDGKLLVDPTLDEEAVCDGMITVVVDAMPLSKKGDMKDGVFLSLQKNGVRMVSQEELVRCMQLALSRGREVRELLQ